MSRYLDHPFSFDERGKSGTTAYHDHVRDMVYQVLFTDPGERVNRPDFGCGLRRLLFEPNSHDRAAATNSLVLGSLQRWLGDVIQVNRVAVEPRDGELSIDVDYTVIETGQREEAHFEGVGQ